MNRSIVALVAVSFLGLAAGCGQSGPLYLPGNPSRIERVPPPEEQADEEKEKSKDSSTASP